MDNLLVSVAVITYNSSKYVLEALDSVRNQTYSNIELIISDDCSTDNTIELCNRWIDENRSKLSRIELMRAVRNSGVSANCNRAINACKGKWIKLLAADDILMSDCISDCVEYVHKHPDCKILFGRHIYLFDMPNEKNILSSEDIRLLA